MTQITHPHKTVLSAGATQARTIPHWRDLYQLTKPRITLMVGLTTAMGAYVAATQSVPLGLLAVTVIGASLACMGASSLNQALERHTDAMMLRTQDRPLPAGRMTMTQTVTLGLLLTVVGVGMLAVWSNLLAAGLCGFTVLSYAAVYTPMKRWTSLSTIVGAVPGALPPVIGAAGVTGTLSRPALLLFAIMFLWQLPHFLAIAWLYRDDYARAKFPMLPVLEPDGYSTFRQILHGCMALLPLSLMPTMFGVAGIIYFWGALVCGLGFLATAIVLAIRRDRFAARLVFFASLLYLPAVFILMLADKVPAGFPGTN